MQPMRRCFLLALLFACSPADGTGEGTREEPVELPSVPQGPQQEFRAVVLVTIDTLRADHLSLYGYLRETAPFLTDLAGRGVLFENAQATMSYTSPSHTSMLTGLHPFQHGVLINGQPLDPSVPNVVKVFRDAGFETGAFLSATFLKTVARSFEHVYVGPRRGRAGVDHAVKWVRELKPDAPFFLWLHLFDVHQWEDEDGFARRLKPRRQPRPLEGDAWYDYLAGRHGWPKVGEQDPFPELAWDNRGKVVRSRKELLDAVDRYDVRIRYADESLRLLFDAVGQVVAGDPMLWIVASDHGEGLGSHGYKGHSGSIYQEQLHVPLVVFQQPELPPRRVGDVVSLVDLAPTLAATLHSDLGSAEGRSLWPLIHGDESQPARPALAQRSPVVGRVRSDAGDVFALISEGRKYLYRTKYDDAFFDLEQDPWELSGDPGVPEAAAVREMLHAKLKAIQWRADSQDTDMSEFSEELLKELKALGYVE